MSLQVQYLADVFDCLLKFPHSKGALLPGSPTCPTAYQKLPWSLCLVQIPSTQASGSHLGRILHSTFFPNPPRIDVCCVLGPSSFCGFLTMLWINFIMFILFVTQSLSTINWENYNQKSASYLSWWQHRKGVSLLSNELILMIFDVVSKANDSLDPKASFPHIYFAVTGHSLDQLLIDLDLNE